MLLLFLKCACAWGRLYIVLLLYNNEYVWGRLYSMLLLYNDECAWGKHGHGQNWLGAEQYLDT